MIPFFYPLSLQSQSTSLSYPSWCFPPPTHALSSPASHGISTSLPKTSYHLRKSSHTKWPKTEFSYMEKDCLIHFLLILPISGNKERWRGPSGLGLAALISLQTESVNTSLKMLLLSKFPPPNWVQYLSTNLSPELSHSHPHFYLHTPWLFNSPLSTSLLMFFLSSACFSGLLVVPKGMAKNVQGHEKWKMITHFSKWERKKKSKEGRKEGTKREGRWILW